MASPQPFQPFFEHFGQAPVPHASTVNAAATAKLEEELRVPVDSPGRGILLRSPRAGYGKTHLIDHVGRRLASGHEFIPLRPLDGKQVNARAAVEDALRRLTRQLPAGGGLTALDLSARKILAHGLEPLVVSGEVPCQDREAAVQALQQRPVETFDFHHPQAVTAHWTRENFEVLGPRLSLEVSRTTGCSLNQVAFWLAALFRFSVAAPEHPGRTGMLLQSAVDDADAERFGTLLALLSRFNRIVLVVDDLEGVHGSPESARRVAGFLATVRQEAPRVDIVVSINDDVWDSAFVPALSGGLLDRLSETTIRLDGLSRAELIALLESRIGESAARVLERVNPQGDDQYARRLLRLASEIGGSLEREEAAEGAPDAGSAPPRGASEGASLREAAAALQSAAAAARREGQPEPSQAL